MLKQTISISHFQHTVWLCTKHYMLPKRHSHQQARTFSTRYPASLFDWMIPSSTRHALISIPYSGLMGGCCIVSHLGVFHLRVVNDLCILSSPSDQQVSFEHGLGMGRLCMICHCTCDLRPIASTVLLRAAAT